MSKVMPSRTLLAKIKKRLTEDYKYPADSKDIKKMKVRLCPDIKRMCGKKDEFSLSRAYCHVGHMGKWDICIDRMFKWLPMKNRIGLLLHEIGHLLAMGGEPNTDLYIWRGYGIEIKYDKDRELQYVDKKWVDYFTKGK